MRVIFFKALRPPKQDMAAAVGAADKDDKDGAGAADDADKPAHEHLRELADVLEAREGGGAGQDGGAQGGDAANGDPAAGANAGGGDPAAAAAAGGAGGAGGGEFGPDSVSAGDFVAFSAGSFESSGKVSAVGEHGCTVTDQSGRDWQIHWDEITSNQAAGGADDGGADGADGAAGSGAGAPAAAKGAK